MKIFHNFPTVGFIAHHNNYDYHKFPLNLELSPLHLSNSLIYDLHMKVVKVIYLHCFISFCHKTDSFGDVQLCIECPGIHIPSILCCATDSIPPIRLEGQVTSEYGGVLVGTRTFSLIPLRRQGGLDP